MTTETRYLLGHDETEWDRLREQHRLWRHTLLDALPPLGVGAGARVLEVGCGSGALLRDLAAIAGDGGRVVGVERDPAAAARARDEVADLPQVEVRQGDVFELEGEERFDLVVARWVISFLPTPERAVARLVPLLEPGGHLLIQDYDYDAIRVAPEEPAVRRLFEVTPEAYVRRGGDAWIATRLPEIYARLGLELVEVRPFCKAGPPSSPVFRWAERFFLHYVQRLVDDDLLTAEEGEASRRGWARARETPGTVFFSPLVVNVVGRRPAGGEATPRHR